MAKQPMSRLASPRVLRNVQNFAKWYSDMGYDFQISIHAESQDKLSNNRLFDYVKMDVSHKGKILSFIFYTSGRGNSFPPYIYGGDWSWTNARESVTQVLENAGIALVKVDKKAIICQVTHETHRAIYAHRGNLPNDVHYVDGFLSIFDGVESLPMLDFGDISTDRVRRVSIYAEPDQYQRLSQIKSDNYWYDLMNAAAVLLNGGDLKPYESDGIDDCLPQMYEILNNWLLELSRTKKKRTVVIYKSSVHKYLTFCCDKNIDPLQSETVSIYREWVRTKFAKSTANMNLSALRMFLLHCFYSSVVDSDLTGFTKCANPDLDNSIKKKVEPTSDAYSDTQYRPAFVDDCYTQLFQFLCTPIDDCNIPRRFDGVGVNIDLGILGSEKAQSVHDGVVVTSDSASGTVRIKHDVDGFVFETEYSNLSVISVYKGEKVKGGSSIATLNSNKNHVRFCLILSGTHINPIPYLSGVNNG